MHLVPCLRCCQWITQQKDSNWWMLFSLANNVAWLGLLFFRIVDWFFSWESAWLGQHRVIPTRCENVETEKKNRCVSNAFRKRRKKQLAAFKREILACGNPKGSDHMTRFWQEEEGGPCWRTKVESFCFQCFSCAPQFLLHVPMISSISELSKSFWRTLWRKSHFFLRSKCASASLQLLSL